MDVVTPDGLAAWILERTRSPDRFVFGIAGPPGSGKSTLAARLGTELAAPVVAMDGFHLSNAVLIERGQLGVKGAPETFDAPAFVELVRRLRHSTEAVACPVFDRVTDEPIGGVVRVVPEDVVVVVEGNYLLLDEGPWAALSGLFDAVAYLDLPDDVRVERLVDRHVAFGRGRCEALGFVQRSDELNTQRILPGRGRADVFVAC